MFPDRAISQKFTLSREKASYVIKHALGPLVASDLCKDITKSPGCFTIMFDETTTVQKIKQMDVLVRYWSTAENKVITRYLLSFFFARALADTLVKLFTELIDDDSYGIPWHRFFNTSSDGPHINKVVARIKRGDEEERLQGFASFYCLHIAYCSQRISQRHCQSGPRSGAASF